MKAAWTRAQRLAWGHTIPGRPRRKRTEWKFSPQLLRLREIEKLIRHRHHGPIPDPEGTDDRKTCLAYIRAAALALSGQDIRAWCTMWAPWATEAEILPIVSTAATRRRMMNADGCAGLLGVTMKERTALKLRTIGACDMTARERKKLVADRKRERDRKRQEEKRRAAGRRSRASYEAASLSALKPWEALNMSRRTWYRRGKPTVGTSPSRIDINTKGDTPVPPVQEPVSIDHDERKSARVARGAWGPGTESPVEFQEAKPHGRRFIPMPPPPHLRSFAA